MWTTNEAFFSVVGEDCQEMAVDAVESVSVDKVYLLGFK